MRPTPVGHVELATRPQYPKHLAKGRYLLGPSKVMEHEAGENAVEGTVLERHGVREGLDEIQLPSAPGRFRPGDGEDPTIAIEANGVHGGRSGLQEEKKGTGAAADIEDSSTVVDLSLI